MPKPYSIDLRERVAAFVEEGHSRHAAAAHFKVSVSFVVNLVKAFRCAGAFRLNRAADAGTPSLIRIGRSFWAVAEKDDITMPELATELGRAVGVQADPASLSRWLIRNGYRFKKNTAGQRTRSARHPAGARGMDLDAPAGMRLSRTGWSSSTRPERPPR